MVVSAMCDLRTPLHMLSLLFSLAAPLPCLRKHFNSRTLFMLFFKFSLPFVDEIMEKQEVEVILRQRFYCWPLWISNRLLYPSANFLLPQHGKCLWFTQRLIDDLATTLLLLLFRFFLVTKVCLSTEFSRIQANEKNNSLVYKTALWISFEVYTGAE